VPNFFQNLFDLLFAKPAPPDETRKHDPDATLPLPPLSDARPTPLPLKSAFGTALPKRLTLGIAQDVGKVRSHNEDVLLVFTGELGGLEAMPNFGLFIVADGMGGHSLGERASSVAARTLARSALEQILPSLLADPQTNVERPMLSEVMEHAMAVANSAVLKAVPDGGTTLTGALVLGEQVILAHVGDSRAYIVTAEGIEQVTRDHSLVQRLKELGQITADEAAIHPQRSVLYKAVGQSEGLEVDVISRRLAPGAILLLCSDGLWSLVGDPQIFQIIQKAANLQAAGEALVAAANGAGGPDNITAVLVQLPS
jgi:PPM family protein phosphatase